MLLDFSLDMLHCWSEISRRINLVGGALSLNFEWYWSELRFISRICPTPFRISPFCFVFQNAVLSERLSAFFFLGSNAVP